MEKTCSQCGEVKPDVKERLDPYEEDVMGDTVIRLLCDDCYNMLCDEI